MLVYQRVYGKNKSMFQTTNQNPIPSATAHHAHHEALHLRVIRLHMAPPAEMALFQRWNLLFSPWNTRKIMVNLGNLWEILGKYMSNKSEKDILGIWLWEFITGNGILKQHKISKIRCESKVGATDWLAIWHLPEPRDAIWPYGWSTSVSHGMAAYPMENHPSDPFQHDFPVPNHHPIKST